MHSKRTLLETLILTTKNFYSNLKMTKVKMFELHQKKKNLTRSFN